VDPDGNTEILLTHKNLTQMQGDRKLFELKEWNTTSFKGNYTVGANVSTVSDADTTNNRMEQSFWIVEPPNVNFTYTAKYLHVGDTVTFNATISTHNMPDGDITHWEWKVYKGDVKDENLNYTYDGGPIMNFTFDEWSDKWPVILNVTDNYGLFYMGYDRISTTLYNCQQNMVMTEAPEEEEAGWPPMWTYALILVIIIIIVVAVYALKFRKPEPE
jgi:plastocyanin